MSLIHPRSYPGSAPASWVEILITIMTRNRDLMVTATGIGLASITLLCLSDSGVTFEHTPQQVLFVNSNVGNESKGNGSESAPFKTITQALQVAQPNSVIVLSTGTYSISSGETFPLILKPGVSIQGDPGTRGSNVVIQGGGYFLSPTFARQNITILGANQASLSGVTVTNPNSRGYGLWIESSSPVVNDNTFTGNRHDGISITGNSAPTIRSNYFYQNGANGMTIYGTSRPQVQDNVFEKTGFGINIAQKAAPVLFGNRITKNLDGVVTQASSQPVLRDNVIEGNTRDGVVAIATSQPNLGTKTEPGGNVFRNNGRYDINSRASSLVIPAFGNQLANARTTGNVDLAGNSQTASTISIPDQDSYRTTTSVDTIPHSVTRGDIYPQENRNNITAAEFPTPRSLVGSGVKPSPNSGVDSEGSAMTTMSPIEIPVPPPASGSSAAIEIPVPPAASKPVAPPQLGGTVPPLPVLQPAPIVVSELLPVPSRNIPFGNTRKLPKVKVPGSSRARSAGSPPPPPTRATALGLRYRVVVEAKSQSKQALVRSLVPGAFRTFSNGRVLMQTGAFSDRAEADKMLQMLKSKGLRAAIEQLN